MASPSSASAPARSTPRSTRRRLPTRPSSRRSTPPFPWGGWPSPPRSRTSWPSSPATPPATSRRPRCSSTAASCRAAPGSELLLTHVALHLAEPGPASLTEAEAPDGLGLDADGRLAAVVGAQFGGARHLDQPRLPRVDTGQVVDDERRSTGGFDVVVLAGLGQVEAPDHHGVAVDPEPDRCDVGLSVARHGGDAGQALALQVLEFRVGKDHR